MSGSRDATLRMWDISSGECLHVLMGHVAAVRCVQYDGRLVVSGAYDYMVKVKELPSYIEISPYCQGITVIVFVVFSKWPMNIVHLCHKIIAATIFQRFGIQLRRSACTLCQDIRIAYTHFNLMAFT